jgi:hypothetical protein
MSDGASLTLLLLSHPAGVGGSRINRIDRDSAVPNLVRKGYGEGIKRRLRRGVCDGARHRPPPWLILSSGSGGIANGFLHVAVRIGESALQENKIEPAVKLASHLAQMAYRVEAKLPMKMD